MAGSVDVTTVSPDPGDRLDRTREELASLRNEVDREAQTRDVRAEARLDLHPRSARVVSLGRRVMREQSAEQVGLAASGAAFWLVITVLPTAIAALSIYGLVVSPQTVARELAGLANKGPQSLGATLAQQLQKVAAADRSGLTAGLVVSVVLAVWTASSGVYNLERAIRAAYGLRPEEYVRARGRAFVGAFVAVLSLGVVAFLSTAASVVVDYLPVLVAVVVGLPVLVVLVAATTATLYRFSIGAPVPLRRLLPGSIAASLCLAVVVGGFAVYLRLSTRYTAVYGALAGTVIGMIGTYLSVYVVLLGAVLNAQLAATPSAPAPAAG
jgi:membrane protein